MNPDPAARTARQAVTAALRCYYTDPAKRHLRPNCQQLAAVAYGPILLCADCDQARSLIGENSRPRPVPTAELHLVADAAHLSVDAERLLAHPVTAARRAGATWAQIADAAGLTRQKTRRHWQHPTTTQPKP